MSVIEQRIRAYDRFVRLPWKSGLSGSEKVWMVIYPPSEERRLRRRIHEFELATTGAGHAGRRSTSRRSSLAGWPTTTTASSTSRLRRRSSSRSATSRPTSQTT